ncbi:MAG: sulfurtransferase TusA family protein [Chloroflexi bacterium]|uniref:Sulfurtransferase TusA family protein n=1 Tax=Candidatus Chlorohelix allophototropha TaxID=3003348 RepID=A0A8T7M164_9CHLR|nr:sulfurtransferase TusA family protein [Chloroflexota bacterium]WJW67186.1 sulfurtransferase TusA family protein [Chloroflexota bacterium L227-S17]
MQGVTINKESDARGSFCPGPLMELIRQVKAAQVGDVIAVISSDEGSKKDIPAWIEKAKQEFLGMEPFEGSTRFICRKIK